tara:strand:+ start:4654 stop:5688 length:1035 start_codon:yes stop_codon:yes gene_type:complete
MDNLNYPSSLDQVKLDSLIKDKIVLITGGSGALGNALIKRLLSLNPKSIRVFSRDEKLQDMTRQRFPDTRCNYVLGDVRDYHSVRDAVRGADIVIHAAAFKYLDIAEKQVTECLKSNVVGTINVIAAVKDEKNVETCIAISTDKAASPINVYGMSKALMESLFREAESTKADIKTKFVTVRYGNVLMTTGSVVPIWKKAYEENKEIKVTNPNMTRFFFTLDDSINLIFYGLTHGIGGDIISTKMPHVLLGDLAKMMSGGRVPVKIIGERPGEKLHECLIADFECKDTIDVGQNFVIRKHSGIGETHPQGVKQSFTSDQSYRLSEHEALELLRGVGAFGSLSRAI